MSKLTKLLVKPEKKWWQVWIKREIEYHEGVDFEIIDGHISFKKSPPKGMMEINYIYET